MTTLVKCSPLLLGLLTLAAPASAQRSGDWVRLETSQATGRVEGQLLRLDLDSIIVVRGESVADTVAVARTVVKDLRVSQGKRRNTLRGMGIGFAAGATFGGLMGAVTFEPCYSDQFMGCFLAPQSAGEAAFLGGIVGGLSGFVIGTVVGVATKSHRWEMVSVPAAVGIAPVGHGRVAVSARMTL